MLTHLRLEETSQTYLPPYKPRLDSTKSTKVTFTSNKE